MAKKKTTKKSKSSTKAKKSTQKKTSSKAAKTSSRTKSSTKKAASTKKTAKKSTAKKSTTKKTTAKKTTAKKTTAKKVSTKKAAAKAPKKPKNPLTKKQTQHFFKLLLEKRVELVGDIDGMFAEAIHADDADLSHMPLHMADVGSDNYEQELTLGLVESERRLLKQIEEAIVRIQEGTYGVCMDTGVPIKMARLEAKPWAKYCIEAARRIEKTKPRRF